MKKMRSILIVLCITLASLWAVSSVVVAMDQCDVVGNSYTITLDGDDYVLSDFTSSSPSFSPAPRCHGYVTLIANGERTNLEWYLRNGHLSIGGVRSRRFLSFYLNSLLSSEFQALVYNYHSHSADSMSWVASFWI